MRRRVCAGSVLLLLVFCLGCGSLDQLRFWSWGKSTPYEGSLPELFGTIRQRSLELRSCQLEFEVRVTEGETSRLRRGTAWVWGLAVRLEEEISFQPLGGASHEVRVSDGQDSWVYRADEGVAALRPVSGETQEELAGRVARYGPLALVLDVPVYGPNLQVQQVRTRRGKQFRIEISQGAPGGRGPWTRHRTWVDARDFLVRRIQVEGARPQDGRLVRYHRESRYWGYELNPELTQDLFQFSPPVGTRIERLPPI